MYERINFLRERVRLQEAVLQGDKRLAFFTSIGLGLFLLIFVATIGYRIMLSSQLQSIQDQDQQAVTTLATMKNVQDAYMRRQGMMQLSQLVIDKRTKSWDAIKYLYSVLPADSRISTINLSGDNGTLEFTVETPSIFTYKNLSAILQSDEVAASGFKPQLGSLDRSKNGSYSLQVKLTQKAPQAAASASATL